MTTQRIGHRFTTTGDDFHKDLTCVDCGAAKHEWPGDPPQSWKLNGKEVSYYCPTPNKGGLPAEAYWHRQGVR